MGQFNALNTILIVLLVFVALVSLINFRKINIVNKKVNRVKRRYDALFRAQDGDIEDILNQNSLDIIANKNKLEELEKTLESVENLQAISLQKVGLVNYDAFEYLTNKLSYSLCLLDANDNGLIITSIFGREQSTNYIKIITNAKCSEKLSDEENEALKKALK
ncbi:MAG: DUF4446 family protein [Finegoldia magna]|uniref:DUF4446 family protein n=1 Tax=Finegoldia magna TaxID=1260 RepID=UPI0025E37170|nr:DUF4446 family protein [Finegoldia magna]MDU1831758.1 DUF4446 family protein [Finegoldia magna]MDU1879032.1 DUF4446 family protein [Finegoldia magna]MDU5369094.1 DUF4446 family protein [Finegoldia magna]MDU5443331.1 DUF4446 family protein [Finegoldia magna]MDU5977557.1 DUF4446 family protein [Finegoldia magna]